MPVSFNTIPPNIRAPFFYVEVNEGDNGAQFLSRTLLIGAMRSTGDATPEEPVLVNDNQVALFGVDSELRDMCDINRSNAAVQELWALPLEDAGAGVAASGEIRVYAPPRSGTLVYYVGGARYRLAVSAGDAIADIAAAIAAQLAADPTCFVTAAVNGTPGDDGGTPYHIVDVTAKHKGENGNTIGLNVGLRTDDGNLGILSLKFDPMSGGSGNPDITAALVNLGDEEFDFIGLAWSDSSNLDAIEAFLNRETGRWSYARQLYGVCLTARQGTLAELDAYGATRNDPFTSIMGVNNSPSPIWRWAAAYSAKAAANLGDPGTTANVSRPLQTLNLIGVWAPPVLSDRWNLNARNSLYYSGIAGYHVERDGTVSIDREVTTYQTNEWGSPDITWLDLNTPCQIMFFSRFMRQEVTQKHPRQALADDNPVGNPGITTAADVKETIYFAYKDMELRGVVENSDLFYNNLVVERDASDPSRLNCYCPPDVVNQLRIFAMNITTFLQYPQQLSS